MGLAASQGRMLLLTGRRSDIQYQQMALSNQKMSISRESSSLSDTYTDALNKRRLTWAVDGDSITSDTVDLTYGLLMNYGNSPGQYLFSDSLGRVVLDNDYLTALGVSPSATSGTGVGSVTPQKFLQNLIGMDPDKSDLYVKKYTGEKEVKTDNYSNMINTVTNIMSYRTGDCSQTHLPQIEGLKQSLHTFSSQINAAIQEVTGMEDSEINSMNWHSMRYTENENPYEDTSAYIFMYDFGYNDHNKNNKVDIAEGFKMNGDPVLNKDGSYTILGTSTVGITSAESVPNPFFIADCEIKLPNKAALDAFMAHRENDLENYNKYDLNYTMKATNVVSKKQFILTNVNGSFDTKFNYLDKKENSLLTRQNNSELDYLIRLKRSTIAALDLVESAYPRCMSVDHKDGQANGVNIVAAAVNMILGGGSVASNGASRFTWETCDLLTEGTIQGSNGSFHDALGDGDHGAFCSGRIDFGFDGDQTKGWGDQADWSSTRGGAIAFNYGKGHNGIEVFHENIFGLFANFQGIHEVKAAEQEVVLENIDMVDFYLNIYYQIDKMGWVKNSAITDPNDKKGMYLQNQITNGNVFIKQLQTDKTWGATSTSDADTLLRKERDADAIYYAEKEYDKEKDKLDEKEQQIDLQLKNLETQSSSIEAEISSVQQLIKDNVTSGFKMFQA